MALEYQNILDNFNRAASKYDENAVLQKEISSRLVERLSIESLKNVTSILDIGCGTGLAHSQFLIAYPKSEITGLDFSAKMLAQNQPNKRVNLVQSDCHELPFNDFSFDLVFSNMALHWTNEPDVLKESLRILKPGGLLLMSCLGETSLFELKEAFSTIDNKPHVHSFPALHALGDELMKLGFQDIVVNTEVINLTYANLKSLLKDIKASGGQNANKKRAKGLLSKNQFQQLEKAYESYRNDGRLPASYEVVYLRATKAKLEDSAIPLAIK